MAIPDFRPQGYLSALRDLVSQTASADAPPIEAAGDYCICPETQCPSREDRNHCDHWYDGAACCGCAAGPCECWKTGQ